MKTMYWRTQLFAAVLSLGLCMTALVPTAWAGDGSAPSGGGTATGGKDTKTKPRQNVIVNNGQGWNGGRNDNTTATQGNSSKGNK